ncbi:MAG: hypothetical protein A3F24_03205 [Candidatus Colwellbacteria bacterium RIFCSPHIGHO2_12_FULL_44_17]|uniref:Uncharacterized protein n=1 Tax=Candidatus Colwellbacteria bacterium RIFCSPHIGHO2_12_FULL_44_17 TaxID=1797689 RepID=A0A1G1Z3D1_9BACT|nr:MAG: hypothetical protein A3F24_03205 [Candidatus Colwellbacteria bacterium RIFCSPHIGHO2_12_FULL_44_17]
MAAVAIKQCKRCGKVSSSINSKWTWVSPEFLDKAKASPHAYTYEEVDEAHENCDFPVVSLSNPPKESPSET